MSPPGAEHWGAVLPETLKLEEAEAPTVGAAQGSPLWTCSGRPWRRKAERPVVLALLGKLKKAQKLGVLCGRDEGGVGGGQPRGLCAWHFHVPEYGLL